MTEQQTKLAREVLEKHISPDFLQKEGNWLVIPFLAAIYEIIEKVQGDKVLSRAQLVDFLAWKDRTFYKVAQNKYRTVYGGNHSGVPLLTYNDIVNLYLKQL